MTPIYAKGVVNSISCKKIAQDAKIQKKVRYSFFVWHTKKGVPNTFLKFFSKSSKIKKGFGFCITKDLMLSWGRLGLGLKINEKWGFI